MIRGYVVGVGERRDLRRGCDITPEIPEFIPIKVQQPLLPATNLLDDGGTAPQRGSGSGGSWCVKVWEKVSLKSSPASPRSLGTSEEVAAAQWG